MSGGEDETDITPPAKRRRISNALSQGDGAVHRKRRTVLACDICRSRRTKCDGEKPTCSFCKESGNDCTYRPIREQPPSKLETDISTIRERLDHIEGLLARRPSSVSISTESPVQHDPTSPGNANTGRNVDIPVMIIQDVGFMKLMGINYDLANHLVSLERADSKHAAHGGRMLVLQQHRALEALDAFYEKVHVWFPILHPRFREQYICVISGPLHPSTEACLALIVSAIGCLPDVSALHVANRSDIKYANAALEMLPTVLIECSVTAVQCLISIALYYCCAIKPIQAYDYVLIASMKIQTLLKTAYNDYSPEDMELVRRSYWAVLILEEELSTPVDVPSSRIWELDDTLPLPSSYLSSWAQPTPMPTGLMPVASLPSPPVQWSDTHARDAQSTISPYASGSSVANNSSPAEVPELRSPAAASEGPSREGIEFFYLAEIAMRRMLHRCTTSTRRHPTTRVPLYAPLVAAELIYQLEKWHCHLPGCLTFEPERDPETRLPPLPEFLRTQYYSCKTSIYWPAAFQAIRDGETANSDVLSGAKLFFDSYARFIMSITISVQCCSPNMWILYASISALTMAAFKAASTPCLQAVTPGELGYCFELALRAFDGIAGVSPSLDRLSRILKEQLRGESA